MKQPTKYSTVYTKLGNGSTTISPSPTLLIKSSEAAKEAIHDKSSGAAKEAIHNLAEKGKEIAMADLPGQDSTDWKTLAAGYSLYRICERVKGRLSNVKAMLDELQKSLADVIGECIEKVAGVIMEDCREWAVSMDEEKVWKAGLVAGKAKGVIQKVGWNLKWTDDGVRVQSRKEEDDDIEVGNVANRSAFLKFPTFNDV